MSHKYQLNVADIARQINAAAYECSSSLNDGFLSWGYKQDLYRLQWLLTNAIKRCPTFAPEEDWLREQEKNKVLGYLKDEM